MHPLNPHIAPPAAHQPSNPPQDQIKAHITDLMLSAPPRVRAQLSEALSIISSHDFPAKWQVGLGGGGALWGRRAGQVARGVVKVAGSDRRGQVPARCCWAP